MSGQTGATTKQKALHTICLVFQLALLAFLLDFYTRVISTLCLNSINYYLVLRSAAATHHMCCIATFVASVSPSRYSARLRTAGLLSTRARAKRWNSAPRHLT